MNRKELLRGYVKNKNDYLTFISSQLNSSLNSKDRGGESALISNAYEMDQTCKLVRKISRSK